MNPEVAALLWTVVVLLLIRPSLLESVFLLMLLLPTLSILSSLAFPFFEQWPFLRPSSVPMTILAVVLLVGATVYRYRRRRDRSINDRNA
jgi:hypothetical protein